MTETIISLDIAFRRTGYMVFDLSLTPIRCGVIETRPSDKKQRVRVSDDNARRSAGMARELIDLIRQNNVRLILGELPSGGAKSARASSQMAIASAVVSVVAEILNIPSIWATPNEVKLALCHDRKASKQQMIEQARSEVSIEMPKSSDLCEHVADAYGVMKALQNESMVRMLRLKNAAPFKRSK